MAGWVFRILRNTAVPASMLQAMPLLLKNFPALIGGVGVILSAHTSLGSYPIAAFGNEEQKKKILGSFSKR